MTTLLLRLRENAPHVTARQFLATQPASWIQYWDDSPAKNPAKALSARTFDPETARRKQRERCAIGFSLQAFGDSRTKAGLLCFHNLGVDVDLIPAAARAAVTADGIDRRKEEYMRRCLVPFPLRPQYVIETRHGFHVIFRIQPLREPNRIDEALRLNHRLVHALRGDSHAVLLTQLLRVPGTLQFKVPTDPFLCRLLVDNAPSIPPYEVDAIKAVLDTLEVFDDPVTRLPFGANDQAKDRDEWSRRWREKLQGVPEGQRNAAAASVVGGFLRRLPEEFWETAGWGGLKEWNSRCATPLTQRELRAVYKSIARREAARRQSPYPAIEPNSSSSAFPTPHAEQ